MVLEPCRRSHHPRTVKYHLSKVFTKLGISSRSQLYRDLPCDSDAARSS